MHSAILVVTTHRLLVCSQSLRTFGPKALVAEWPRAQVQAAHLADGKATTIVSVEFADGSIAQIESMVTAKPALVGYALTA